MAKQQVETHGKLRWIGNEPIIFLENMTPNLAKALQFFSGDGIDPNEREIRACYPLKKSRESSKTVILIASGSDPRAVALDFQSFGIIIEVTPETPEFQPCDVF